MNFKNFNITWKNKSSADKQNEKNNCPGGFNLESAKTHEGTHVPEIIFRITECLDRNLGTENLYRKPGNKEKILKLHSKPEKINFDKQDVHDVASLLKMILTEMEEPLLPKQIFETFKRTADQSQIKKELEGLNQVRQETLEHLMKHILRVTDNEGVNKMNKENICIVWAPVVYYPLENCSDAEKCIEFFGILMDVYEQKQKTKKVEQSEQKESQVDKNEQKESQVDKSQPKGKQVEQKKRPVKRYKRKAPQPESKAIGKEKDSSERTKESTTKAELTTKENPAEELMAKENGRHDVEEKREEEREKTSIEDVKKLTEPAEELRVKEIENHAIEEKRQEEKGKGYTKDHKTLENEEEKDSKGHTTGLQEEKGNNSSEQTKESVPEVGVKTKEESDCPEKFKKKESKGPTTGLQEEKGNNSSKQTKESVPEVGVKTKEESDCPEKFKYTVKYY